jgi:hypothetical protein
MAAGEHLIAAVVMAIAVLTVDARRMMAGYFGAVALVIFK